ncbi:MAG TPA: DNA topoisomerase IV subunit A [Stellaceae bacterium]|nr:DNA topoisomerase IV subunit A [Stellaceae bacterium]
MATSPAAAVRDVDFAAALGERYLSYALSTIMARSLPDVRDGLKPVHRRLLYAMRELNLDPRSAYKKCARVVGDVIGKFHPHGDVAVYEALVRLAQDFAQRYPLVDGHGNFGNIDGDNAAAMRYTESRLTEVAEALLQGIDESTVDFRPTYDGEGQEPVVLPARFPNLLANGASGIAVGMATSIPPHNAAELCAALVHLVKHPRASVSDLLAQVPGPDFPTGGVLVEAPEAVREAYATGRGSFRLRARWEVEKLAHGAFQVIVTEMPYQVPKSRLVERIATLLEEKKLPLLADVRDQSTDQVRLVLEPKSRNVDPAVLMESLFRATELEVRVPLNLNVLDAQGVPRVMPLKEALQAFLDHRRVVLQRRTRFRLDEIARRSEILRGQMVVYLNLDKVIKLIRESDDPKAEMMKRWKLSDIQAEAILNMRLRALRKLEEIAIHKEIEALEGEAKDLKGLLSDEKRQWKTVAADIAEVGKQFGPGTPLGRRRTEIGKPPAELQVPVEALVEREPCTVICSEKGWIRAVRGRNVMLGDIKYKEGDGPRFAIEAETTDKLLLFATNGRFYTLGIDKLPGGRGHGEPFRLMIDLGNEHDAVVLLPHRPGLKLLVAASDGRGFVVAADEALAQTRAGKQILNLGDGAVARAAAPVAGDTVASVGENRKLLLFPLAEVPEMARGRGVILQRYKQGGLSDLKVFALSDGLTWRRGDQTRTETDLRAWIGTRAQSGRIVPNGFPKTNRFS